MLQELGDVRKERDQMLQQCEDVRAEVRKRVKEVQCMQESSRVLEEQHAAERAQSDATVASLMEVRFYSCYASWIGKDGTVPSKIEKGM